jgi:hypothetical protein
MTRRRWVALALFASCAGYAGCQGVVDGASGQAGAGDSAKPGSAAQTSAANGDEAPGCDQIKLGPRRLWRLTPTQYDNTLHDLFGIDSQFGAGFPADAVVDGFSNNSDALVMTPLMADKLAAAAKDTAAKVDLSKFASCASSQSDDNCLRELIGQLGSRIFRRPLTAADNARYFTLAKLAGPFDSAARLVVSAMLQSPHFLYRFEIGSQAGDARFVLSDYEVASELSYLLWQSMPDAELFDAASKRALHENSQVAAQVDRMLKSPRARPVVRGFVFEWLGLSAIPTVPKDTQRFPELTGELRAALVGEAERFIDHVMFEQDGSIDSLLSSPTTFLDAKLASFYGAQLPAAGASDAPQPVELSNQERRGILTLGGTMLAHSRSNDSSPVHRGKLVRERLLCQLLPPPPVGVVIQPPPLDPTKTARERYAAHSTQEPCATCHRLMDPIGLSFEHFDGVGRFRPTDNGLPIDVSGQILGSSHSDGAFVGTDQLIDKLEASGDARDCYALQWYRFAYGFGEDTNRCLAGRMQRAIGASDGSLTSIVTILTQADGFLAREGSPDATPASVQAPANTPAVDAGAAQADAAMSNPGASVPPDLDVAVSVDNDFGSGYCRTYELHNRGSAPITWSVPLDISGTLNQHWECQITGSTGHVTFSGEDYNRTLQPDAKAQFGFCAQR